MERKTIHGELRRLSFKIWRQKFLHDFIEINFWGSIGALIISIISHIKSVIFLRQKLSAFWIILNVFIIIKTMLHKPSLKEAAACGDRLGLQEKLVTYIEFENKGKYKESSIFKSFKSELEDELQYFDVVKKYKININLKKLISYALIILVSFAVYFIPSSCMEEARESEKIHTDIKNERLNIKEKGKNALTDIKSKNIKKDTSNVLNTLSKELKNNYSYDDALEKINETEQKLNEIENEKYEEDMKTLSQMFKGTSLEDSRFSSELKNGNCDESILNEEVNIPQSDKDKILKNIDNMKEFKDEDVKNAIKNKITSNEIKGKDIIKSLKKSSDGEVKLKEQLNKSLVKLSNQKNQKNFENGSGDKISDNFLLGGKKTTYKYGEKSDIKDTEKNTKGQGNEEREDNNSIGSSKTGENSKVKEKANSGTIKKGEISSYKTEENSSPSLADSKISDNGKLIDKGLKNIKGQYGSKKTMQNAWLNSESTKISSVFKYDIPSDKKSLVTDYFKKLER